MKWLLIVYVDYSWCSIIDKICYFIHFVAMKYPEFYLILIIKSLIFDRPPADIKACEVDTWDLWDWFQ